MNRMNLDEILAYTRGTQIYRDADEAMRRRVDRRDLVAIREILDARVEELATEDKTKIESVQVALDALTVIAAAVIVPDES